ncbi:MmcB family DNA repair protein [Zavarzinia sp. CC-PAN008]|uniref:MmcB family DNA repair protein n=1 Tax=Zavarzinia sp. CC-PAN008 TaxID=3243332 RepID=UPI003F745881
MVAADVCRGVQRLLLDMGYASITELVLDGGRRADIAGIDAKGRVFIVEVKVSMADLRGDRKWPDYLPWCDRFAFAVPHDFPRAPFELEPLNGPEVGLIAADRYGAGLLRSPAERPLAAARRKALALRIGMVGAIRLQRITDPSLNLPAGTDV